MLASTADTKELTADGGELGYDASMESATMTVCLNREKAC